MGGTRVPHQPFPPRSCKQLAALSQQKGAGQWPVYLIEGRPGAGTWSPPARVASVPTRGKPERIHGLARLSATTERSQYEETVLLRIRDPHATVRVGQEPDLLLDLERPPLCPSLLS